LGDTTENVLAGVDAAEQGRKRLATRIETEPWPSARYVVLTDGKPVDESQRLDVLGALNVDTGRYVPASAWASDKWEGQKLRIVRRRAAAPSERALLGAWEASKVGPKLRERARERRGQGATQLGRETTTGADLGARMMRLEAAPLIDGEEASVPGDFVTVAEVWEQTKASKDLRRSVMQPQPDRTYSYGTTFTAERPDRVDAEIKRAARRLSGETGLTVQEVRERMKVKEMQDSPGPARRFAVEVPLTQEEATRATQSPKGESSRRFVGQPLTSAPVQAGVPWFGEPLADGVREFEALLGVGKVGGRFIRSSPIPSEYLAAEPSIGWDWTFEPGAVVIVGETGPETLEVFSPADPERPADVPSDPDVVTLSMEGLRRAVEMFGKANWPGTPSVDDVLTLMAREAAQGGRREGTLSTAEMARALARRESEPLDDEPWPEAMRESPAPAGNSPRHGRRLRRVEL
jgi:hypothetical protein